MITDRIVFPVSSRAPNTGDYAGDHGVPDVLIGGLPFFLDINDQHLYKRSTLPFKRQQIDTSSEPGEQTLSAYWVRDQESWHRGSGINFYEPATDPYSRYRFAKSVGVDIWTVGQLSLLKRTSNVVAAAGEIGVASAIRNGVNGVYYTAGGDLGFCTEAGAATSYGLPDYAETAPVVAGAYVLYGTTEGIVACPVGSEGSAWGLWSIATGAPVKPWWVKSRIIAARDNNLYELSTAGGAIGSPLYTHPDDGWEWTSVTETPDAILAAGRSNGYGGIYAFSLQTSGVAGSTPTLGSAVPVADFPPGEEVHVIKAYLGQFLAIGTTRGVRIALIGSNGQLKYGPLTITTTKPVRALTARDSYVFAGIEADIDGVSGCARIDLSQEITTQVDGIGYSYASTQRYAWAYDVMVTGAATINSLALVGTGPGLALGAQDSGLWVTSPTQYVSSGYVQSGKVRHSTAEQKVFPWLKLRSNVSSDAQIRVNTVDQSGNEVFALAVDQQVDESIDIALSAISELPQAHVAIKTVMLASTDGLTSPVIRHVQLKAMPKPRLQRQITFPLQLADRESDRNGTVFGYPGSAYVRLAALEALQDGQVIVSVTDTTCGETFSATIADIALVRSTPPSRNGQGNFGGALDVTVIKL